MKGLEREWLLLQQQYESYERLSLSIKVVAVIVTALLYGFQIAYGAIFVVLLLLIDCMLKTFQQRLESRLLTVEQFIQNNSQQGGFRLYLEWQNQPRGLSVLLHQYLRAAVRPTQAVIYLLLLIFWGLVQVQWF
ncbi:hypothetical protein [Neptunicella marina]|uniref:Uncharacterized protein n=1 Tax=Neptunicella marina TaxID=2125989 RepID=A0A8J6M016_9ALTE|nr:hypothetical protein [Neptunicella marina]MBC3764587.1 hypothetical protein [Neptunicella marina]